MTAVLWTGLVKPVLCWGFCVQSVHSGQSSWGTPWASRWRSESQMSQLRGQHWGSGLPQRINHPQVTIFATIETKSQPSHTNSKIKIPDSNTAWCDDLSTGKIQNDSLSSEVVCSAARCRAACSGHVDCKTWHYNLNSGQCHMLNATQATTAAQPGFVGGHRECQPSTCSDLRPRFRLDGTKLKELPARHTTDCRQQCQDELLCLGWTWNWWTSSCTLLSRLTDTSYHHFSVSGSRACVDIFYLENDNNQHLTLIEENTAPGLASLPEVSCTAQSGPTLWRLSDGKLVDTESQLQLTVVDNTTIAVSVGGATGEAATSRWEWEGEAVRLAGTDLYLQSDGLAVTNNKHNWKLKGSKLSLGSLVLVLCKQSNQI